MNLHSLPTTFLLTVFISGAFFSCISSKSATLRADDIFDMITQNLEAMKQADTVKLRKVNQFIKVAQKNLSVNQRQIQATKKRLEIVHGRTLNLKKMTSEEIDNYDLATKKLLEQLEKIQKLNPKNKHLETLFREIKEIDSQDLSRRVAYDRAVIEWNQLLKKSGKRLRQNQKYAQAQFLPIFTILE